MPIDPYFTSAFKSRTYSEADKAERDKLRALPKYERRTEYRRLKQMVKNYERVTNGQFLFVRDLDQREMARRHWVNRRNAKIYATLHKDYRILGGGFANLHKQ